ncbi:dipeptidyl-peptidase-4 [Nonlabens dokdonensis]|uniref:Dipeptidyl-peptidase IV n=2 Tax=Nonlabens dokdonensis TaxID=328515 RepID=L7WBA2_NONDD|nr:S9 family peptidase [Nonlabens dokdonensis]AGC77166.1 dipeptidyl-peptidase IV [Nonlabens dokdonensis DSW-6]PZX41124.1 dipeptidyl-peptidase-4 [Nonlabens dokdonensis]
MIKNCMILLAFVFISQSLTAQKNITVEDIYRGEFRTQGLQSLASLNNGTEYLVLNYNRDRTQTIDKYSYKTGEKVATLVNSADINLPIRDYILSDDEKQMMIISESNQIFRRSSYDKVHILNLETNKLTSLSDDLVRSPSFSPDGTKVAYVFENNLYYKDLASGAVIQATDDGVTNALINGVTDWVYEEEFAFVKAYEWSPNSEQIAFISFDESEVPEFSMDVYGNELYQKPYVFKYPKAGEKNAVVALHLFTLATGSRKEVSMGRNEEFYIARIKYSPNGKLAAQLLNRHQNVLNFFYVNPDGKASVAFTETDAAYVDVTDDLTFLEDGSFLWTSEKDNWRHIYLYDANGKEKRQITSGNWDVTSYYGYDTKSKRIYYQSTEDGSINRGIYSISLKAKKKKKLSSQIGTNRASFSKNFTYYINTYSSATTPPVYTLNNAKDGEKVREIKNNNDLKLKLNDYQVAQKEFSTININGNDLNMWTMKPNDFDPNKEYPLFMTQYSGPGSQSVANSWYGANDFWYSMLANEGYVVVCVDGRGTGYKGADFKKITQKELGKYEVEDQIAAAKKLGAMNYIDANRLGIWGWSYGGFMSSNCLFKGNETFSMAIAVAPVTNWRFYDSIYTERYMTTPQENASGYDENSPINHVDKLKGKFLLIHGSADDNVHVQNTMRMVEALVQANKQFDWAIYPDKNHGIYGGNTRVHLYNKMTNFIKENL